MATILIEGGIPLGGMAGMGGMGGYGMGAAPAKATTTTVSAPLLVVPNSKGLAEAYVKVKVSDSGGKPPSAGHRKIKVTTQIPATNSSQTMEYTLDGKGEKTIRYTDLMEGLKYVFTAEYPSTSKYGGSGSSATTTVNKSLTQVVQDAVNKGLPSQPVQTSTVISAPATVKSGQTIRISADVKPLSAVNGRFVEFNVGGNFYTKPISAAGKSEFDFVANGCGNITATARFVGDAEFTPSQSQATSITITDCPAAYSINIDGFGVGNKTVTEIEAGKQFQILASTTPATKKESLCVFVNGQILKKPNGDAYGADTNSNGKIAVNVKFDTIGSYSIVVAKCDGSGVKSPAKTITVKAKPKGNQKPGGDGSTPTDYAITIDDVIQGNKTVTEVKAKVPVKIVASTNPAVRNLPLTLVVNGQVAKKNNGNPIFDRTSQRGIAAITLSFDTPGSVQIQMQSPDGKISPAKTITIVEKPKAGGGGKEDQTINFPNPPDVIGGDTITVNPTATSGLDTRVSLVSGPALATAVSNGVKITTFANSEGVVKLKAEQAGNAEWKAAKDVTVTFSVRKRAESDPPPADIQPTQPPGTPQGGGSGGSGGGIPQEETPPLGTTPQTDEKPGILDYIAAGVRYVAESFQFSRPDYVVQPQTQSQSQSQLPTANTPALPAPSQNIAVGEPNPSNASTTSNGLQPDGTYIENGNRYSSDGEYIGAV